MLNASRSNPPKVIVDRKLEEKILNSLLRALTWSINRVFSWEYIRYPFGPEDLATVISMLCTLHQTGFGYLIKQIDDKLEESPLLNKLVDRLFRENLIENDSNGNSITVSRISPELNSPYHGGIF